MSGVEIACVHCKDPMTQTDDGMECQTPGCGKGSIRGARITTSLNGSVSITAGSGPEADDLTIDGPVTGRDNT